MGFSKIRKCVLDYPFHQTFQSSIRMAPNGLSSNNKFLSFIHLFKLNLNERNRESLDEQKQSTRRRRAEWDHGKAPQPRRRRVVRVSTAEKEGLSKR